MKIEQTRRFMQAVKKLHSNQKADLDKAVRILIETPEKGDLKKDSLAEVSVYKFKMQNQLTLLTYRFIDDVLCLILLSVGSHENFYRDLSLTN